MLLHLYSAQANPIDGKVKSAVKLDDEERPRVNGHHHAMRVPSASDRQAHDAQDFELEGLMSEDEDEGVTKNANGGSKVGNGGAR